MILVELNAAIDAAGTVRTFYISSGGFITTPDDTPANTAFLPRLMERGAIGVSVFSNGRTNGDTQLEAGQLLLTNTDGGLDAWKNYSFDGRTVTIRSGDGSAYPGDFPVLLTGTVQGVEVAWDKVVITLRDLQYIFTLPALTSTYAGDNALPNGLEGTADDIKGQKKPRTYGVVKQIAPPCVNTSKLTFQVNQSAVASIAVYDRGAALTPGTNYATSSLLQAATVSSGTFATCLAEGYFRLGSAPTGTVTADVTEGASAADRTAAQILKRLALAAGVDAGAISAADVTALDAACAYEVGLYMQQDDPTSQEAIDAVAQSIGAYCGFDPDGTLRMGRLLPPDAAPLITVREFDLKGEPARKPPKDNGVPVWSVTVNHTRYWETQTSDVAGAVPAATRAALAQEYRAEVAADATVKNQWLTAGEMVIESLLTVAANALAEAARLLSIYKVRRDIFEVKVDLDRYTKWRGQGLRLTDAIGLQIRRFGLNDGVTFRLIGVRLEFSTKSAVLTIWG